VVAEGVARAGGVALPAGPRLDVAAGGEACRQERRAAVAAQLDQGTVGPRVDAEAPGREAELAAQGERVVARRAVADLGQDQARCGPSGLAGGGRAAGIARVADAVAVGVRLARVERRRAHVARVAHAVPVRVLLAGVGDARAVVARGLGRAGGCWNEAERF